ncbi:MAG: hypothetical protein R3314_03690, partial [Longimicrobiales bacterium]|nr:hypothetical protein [Longimicrobiales bacterium]
MTSIAKLKDKARKHEQKEDWQAAIEAYRQVLDKQADEESLDLDLGLFNRIGDLNLRIGRVDDAVEYYERAADKYAEQGLYNNAIALCNKALRHRPNRAPIYLKLSRLCSEQGFETDARRWILEYAERQVAVGEVEAALTGLEEFAELSDDPEVRELLAQQLVTHGREDEAMEQLRAAYRMRVLAGDAEAAAAVATRAKDIDPGVDLTAEPDPEPPTDAEEGSAIPTLEPGEERSEEAGAEAAEAPSDEQEEAGEVGIAEPLETTAAEVTGEVSPPDTLEGLETRPDAVEEGAVEGIEGLESTAETAGVEESTGPGAGAAEVTGLEVSHGERAAAEAEAPESDTLGGLETFDAGAPEEQAADVEDEEEAEPLPLLDESYEPDDELVPEAGGEADLNVEELAAAEPDEEAPEP